jgi:hypothetical protein
MFITSNREEAIETAEDFGQGMVVVSVDEKGSKQRVFTASYGNELRINE